MRMEDDRLVKATCLGWMEELEGYGKLPGKKRKTVLFWKNILREAGIDWTQIGQLCSDRTEWRSQVRERVRHIEEWERLSGHGIDGERGDRKSPTPQMDDDQFLCNACDKVCKSKAGLTIQFKRKHAVSKEKVTFECTDCKESFL